MLWWNSWRLILKNTVYSHRWVLYTVFILLSHVKIPIVWPLREHHTTDYKRALRQIYISFQGVAGLPGYPGEGGFTGITVSMIL